MGDNIILYLYNTLFRIILVNKSKVDQVEIFECQLLLNRFI